MKDLVRREVVETAQSIVVKVGTSVLSNDDDTLNVPRLQALTEEIRRIREAGRKVVIVSSGAIGAGVSLLGLSERPRDLPHLQAAAAVGQARLMRHYDDCLQTHGYHAAQLLLTTSDFEDRTRYLNVRNTIRTLFELGAVPVINENDTVSVDEIRFGDNDRLAAMVTNLLEAPLLVILSTVGGLYDGDPEDAGSTLIPLVKQWDDRLLEYASGRRTRHGTGGMQAKLDAVRSATAVGENVIIAGGSDPQVLSRIMAGEEIGTLFLAQGSSASARKRWIGYSKSPKGHFFLDAGAHEAIQKRGGSLLAVGLTKVRGNFAKGDLVALLDPQGVEFARGLTNYNSQDVERLAGKKAQDGTLPYDEVVHRDNLVVTARPG